MITGAIKNKVDKIWLDIFSAGLANPLTVIEQLTYLMFIRSLDAKELENESLESLGVPVEKIFPQTPSGQAMRWSRFKDKDPREIFNIMSQRIFPAVKLMKNGRLPDFNDQGEPVEIPDAPGSADEGKTAFARYMDDAMFLIPTPQVLQKIRAAGKNLQITEGIEGFDTVVGFLGTAKGLQVSWGGAVSERERFLEALRRYRVING